MGESSQSMYTSASFSPLPPHKSSALHLLCSGLPSRFLDARSIVRRFRCLPKGVRQFGRSAVLSYSRTAVLPNVLLASGSRRDGWSGAEVGKK